MNKIIQGDCLDVLRKGTADSVDCVVTDPPYGYSFMGKDWDKAVPSVEIWKECLRVLKPGAFAFVMSAPRQDVLSQMIVRLTEAGFDTSFTSIYWTYASGFPKAMNVAKAVDKRMGVEFEASPASGVGFMNADGDDDYNVTKNKLTRKGEMSPEAQALDGSYGGFQPKPAVEIIIVAMKPLSEKTYVDQALKNGKGVTWLDDARIPTAEKVENHGRSPVENGWDPRMSGVQKQGQTEGQKLGRFPANLICSDDILNDGKERKSGVLDPSKHRRKEGPRSEVYGKFKDFDGFVGNSLGGGDSGSYSRFFSLDAWASKLPESVQRTFPFLVVAKASKREKNEGLDEFEEKERTDYGGFHSEKGLIENGRNPENRQKMKNSHATVKPLQLMSYLITLGSRPGDTVLDPFLGSGTTACAAKALGRGYIGIEREPEYAKIAQARVNAIEGTPCEFVVFTPPVPPPPAPAEDAAARRSRLIDEELSGRKLTAEEVKFLSPPVDHPTP